MIAIKDIQLWIVELQARMPFRYGIVTMTELPHLVVQLTLSHGGKTTQGLAADHLPPKWFTKNPDTSFAADLVDMRAVIDHAAEVGLHLPPQETVFDFWQALYKAQQDWGEAQGHPALLWNFGVSLIERAAIDAFCRAEQSTFAAAVHNGRLGFNPGAVHAELAGTSAADWLPPTPVSQFVARHTVGLTDPLTEDDIPPAERVSDGLPQSLAACIDTYQLTHFKIKLGSNIEQDRARLAAIANLLAARNITDYAFTLDSNEQFYAVADFQTLWSQLQQTPGLASFLEHLIFVEQPFHRDVALSPATATALLNWVDRPPLIIDESDGALNSLPVALKSGYSGTSHKNCKGVFKGLANACLLRYHQQQAPDQVFVLSGEDLSNIGPLALLQDLAVLTTLGVSHAERNGHHYFRGLASWPPALQNAILTHHNDLYRRHPDGYPTLRVQQGTLNLGSVVGAPFGYSFDWPPALFNHFTPWGNWDSSHYA